MSWREMFAPITKPPLPGPSLFNPKPKIPQKIFPPLFPAQISSSSSPGPLIWRSIFAMADQNNANGEVMEPLPKIPKLQQGNGVHERTTAATPACFFKVKKLSEKAVLPSRGSSLAAGYDLSSATETKVPARGKALVPTDLSIAVSKGTYARIALRSGLAWKHSIDVGAGVVDADYRGPVGVILFNHLDVDFEVKPGDRIAQLIIEKIVSPDVMEVEDLDATVRDEEGFGSTGV